MPRVMGFGLEIALPTMWVRRAEVHVFRAGRLSAQAVLRPRNLRTRWPRTRAMRDLLAEHARRCRTLGRLLRHKPRRCDRWPYFFYAAHMPRPGLNTCPPLQPVRIEWLLDLFMPHPAGWPPIPYYMDARFLLHPIGHRELFIPHKHWTPLCRYSPGGLLTEVSPNGLEWRVTGWV